MIHDDDWPGNPEDLIAWAKEYIGREWPNGHKSMHSEAYLILRLGLALEKQLKSETRFAIRNDECDDVYRAMVVLTPQISPNLRAEYGDDGSVTLVREGSS